MLRIKSTRKEPIKKFNISLFLSLFHHKKVEMKGKIWLALGIFFFSLFLLFLHGYSIVKSLEAQATETTTSTPSIIGEFYSSNEIIRLG